MGRRHARHRAAHRAHHRQSDRALPRGSGADPARHQVLRAARLRHVRRGLRRHRRLPRARCARAAKPRLFEELLRLLREGAAHRSFWLAWETGVLDVLLPELSTYLADLPEDDDTFWRLLDEVDRRTKERGEPLDEVVLIAMLLLEPMREACVGRARSRRGRLPLPRSDRRSPERPAPHRRARSSRRRHPAAHRGGSNGSLRAHEPLPVAHEIASLYAAAHGRELVDAPEPTVSSSDALESNRRRRRRRR